MEVIKSHCLRVNFFFSSPEDVLGKYRSIVLLRTDVLANTGMEAAEIIAAAVNQINASAIIVIDALAGLGGGTSRDIISNFGLWYHTRGGAWQHSFRHQSGNHGDPGHRFRGSNGNSYVDLNRSNYSSPRTIIGAPA